MLIATRERANARCLATKAHGPDVKDTKKMRWTLNPNTILNMIEILARMAAAIVKPYEDTS